MSLIAQIIIKRTYVKFSITLMKIHLLIILYYVILVSFPVLGEYSNYYTVYKTHYSNRWYIHSSLTLPLTLSNRYPDKDFSIWTTSVIISHTIWNNGAIVQGLPINLRTGTSLKPLWWNLDWWNWDNILRLCMWFGDSTHRP